jgi:hypothetical protein
VEAEKRYISALLSYWVVSAEVDQLRAGSVPGAAPASMDTGETSMGAREEKH